MIRNKSDNNDWTEVKTKKSRTIESITNKTNNYEKNNKNSEKCHKKTLCNNILLHGKCSYGDKCLFAHNLDDQNVENIRKKAYDIINKKILFTSEILNDQLLLDNLLILTKTCQACLNNNCPGGYNCKFGAINYKSTLCYDDLIMGICENHNCIKIHLNDKQYQKINISTNKFKKYSDVLNINRKLNTEYEIDNNNELIQIIPNAKLLSEDFFANPIINKENIETNNNTESDEELEKDIIEALKDCNIDLCKKSIFT